MSRKQVNVRVLTMDAELEFVISSNTTGKQLFDQVARTIGLREVWFFGLHYVDNKGLVTWIKLNKKVLQQIGKKCSDAQLSFRVKFFPEDVSQELIIDNTQRLFFLQVKDSILSDTVFCPAETSVLLASYALQAKFGDYEPQLLDIIDFTTIQLLPHRVVQQHKLTSDNWQQQVLSWYQEHSGMLRDEAMMEYLMIAQDLEMYGVNYYEIHNKKRTELWLGVDALGLNIYEKANKLNPKIGFPWSEIRNISFTDKKFSLTATDHKAPEFVFYTSHQRVSKHILAMCMGNHELYMRRRQPESLEIQQLREAVKQNKLTLNTERQQLLKERKQKEVTKKQRQMLEERLLKYEADLQKACLELEKSKQFAATLELKVQEIESQRHEILKAFQGAEEARITAETSAHLSKQQREIKEVQAVEAKANLELKMCEAHERTVELANLQQQLATAQQQMKANKQRLEQTLQHSHTLMDDVKLRCSTQENESQQITEERVVHMKKNRQVYEQLKTLSAQLADAKHQTRLTRCDLLQTCNRSTGYDKYKALKQIQRVDTKQRVETFESL